MHQTCIKTLEFNKIKTLLLEYTSTDYAKAKINELYPFLSEARLKQATQETNDARAILDYAGNPPAGAVDEVKKLIETADKDGILYPEQFDKLLRFIASCRRMKTYLKKCESTGKGLAFCGVNLDTLEELYNQTVRCISNGDIDSNASKALSKIRYAIEHTNGQIKIKLEELLKSKKSYFADGFISMRNGRYTLPVKREYKHQITGSVIAVSSTGSTCFIEPNIAVKLTDKLNTLKTEEEIEKEKILYELTALVNQNSAQIAINIEVIETLDFAFAKGRLSIEMCAVPADINTERRICIQKGRHPLIDRDTCVPVDFELGGNTNGIIITGPNTGGKTVVLKLVGLFSLMAQCGLHIPCESASICMNSNILCDIGDGQDISENLSTFSAHITNIIAILQNTGAESLVLLDELGSGTDPSEGMGIAIAVIEELRRKNCLLVATTHYAEVKAYAEKTPLLTNARMTFDRETLKPEYRLIIGEAGESCALYIAKRLGFPQHMLEYAYHQTYRNAASDSTQTDTAFLIENIPSSDNSAEKQTVPLPKIQKASQKKAVSAHALSFNIGDSVIVHPNNILGIIYQTANDKGELGVQIRNNKQLIIHKRLTLKTPASELYPPDYDFSVLFDTVEDRKARHKMNKKHQPGLTIIHEKE